jgi:hypothetical protein
LTENQSPVTEPNVLARQGVLSELSSSRTPIAMLSLLLWVYSLALGLFVLSSSLLRDPETGTMIVAQDPWIVITNLCRGLAHGYVALLLWRYQKAIQSSITGAFQVEGFSVAHNRLWIRSAMLMGVMTAISVVYFIVSQYETIVALYDSYQ